MPLMFGQLRFQFSEQKALEAVTFIAERWPHISAFYASKVLFFAEKWHLNRYARPIVADTFIAMPNGPVPSTIYDFFKGQLGQAGDPEAITNALVIRQTPHPSVSHRRPADTDVLSPSDIECLEEAIAYCRGKSFSALSSLTHQERAWQEAQPNGPMDYANMIDADAPPEVLEEAREFAAYGVL